RLDGTTWRTGCSELGCASGTGVGDGVADVGEAADIDQQAFETEAEAGMRHRAITAQVTVPAIGRRIEAELDHAPVEVIQSLLALRATGGFADGRCQHVHRGHGL